MKWTYVIPSPDRVVFRVKVLLKIAGWQLALHKFEQADPAGCFHSHPAWAWRLVLWGGYVEEVAAFELVESEIFNAGTVIYFERWHVGRFGFIAPEFEHRIDRLLNGRSSWSLWIRGPIIAPINVRGCD